MLLKLQSGRSLPDSVALSPSVHSLKNGSPACCLPRLSLTKLKSWLIHRILHSASLPEASEGFNTRFSYVYELQVVRSVPSKNGRAFNTTLTLERYTSGAVSSRRTTLWSERDHCPLVLVGFSSFSWSNTYPTATLLVSVWNFVARLAFGYADTVIRVNFVFEGSLWFEIFSITFNVG